MEQGKTEETRRKNRRRTLRCLGCVLFIAVVMAFGGRALKAEAGTLKLAPDTSGSLEGESKELEIGKVTAKVANVRTGPSSDSDENKLTVGGKNVQVKNGDVVTIIDEVTNTKNEKWVQIRFTYEGTELEGYCLASFVKGTGEMITPTPTPSPTPTPEPTTEATTAAPTTEAKTTAPADKGSKGGGSTKILLIVFLILFVLAAAYIAYYFLVYKKQKEEQRQKKQQVRPAAQKRAPGENGQARQAARPNAGGPGRTTGQPKPVNGANRPAGQRPAGAPVKRPQGTRPAAGGVNRPNQGMPAPAEQRRAGAPAHKPAETAAQANKSVEAPKVEQNKGPVMQEKPESASEAKIKFTAQDSFTPEDRTALRDEINNLEAGDYVMHKYLGVGQVYDNSDVKLIEIRFGSDMRFLNKESCIMKRILRKCREDEL